MELLKKEYDGESICDLQRDVVEAFNPKFTPAAQNITQDENGFQLGRFIVSIEWKLDS